MATPYGAPAIQDAQFYFYLCDDSQHVLDKQDLVLNLSENTEYVWLTVEEALKRYQEQTLPMFPPQLAILLQLRYHGAQSFSDLKAVL